ncbi:hypothetical protein [Tropicimonas sp.]|uniref:hypothetical protein n=1 Tax=Tropicimonas sp. TaxID=2067044 RepID=UPI003A87FA3A
MRVQIPPLRRIGAFVFLSLALSAAAMAGDCDEALRFEEEINRTLPRDIDAATELVQVRVNCATRTLSYIKRIFLFPDEMAPGWQERKQRQFVQLHCNARGLASVQGWTVRDEVFDPDYNHLVTLRAAPADCRN